MAQIFRVGGGYTAFVFNGRPLAYLEIIEEVAPRPVVGPEQIHPLDNRHPVEIVFPTAHEAGTLRLGLKEQWASNAWEQLPGYQGARDIIDVFTRNINLGTITCAKIIRLPNGRTRTTQYHNCVITDINDSERVDIRTLSLPKTITIMFTHKTQR